MAMVFVTQNVGGRFSCVAISAMLNILNIKSKTIYLMYIIFYITSPCNPMNLNQPYRNNILTVNDILLKGF